MKTAKDLKEQFRRLEAIGNDDFELILLDGAYAFATHELSQMLRQLKVRRIRCQNGQQRLLRRAAFIPGLLLLSLVFLGLQWLVPLRVTLVAAALATLTFVYHSRRHRDFTEEVQNRDRRIARSINHELRRRRSGVV